MNPKSSNQLDPKLKEAYDRVMGTALNSPKPAEQKEQPEPQLQSQHEAQPAQPASSPPPQHNTPNSPLTPANPDLHNNPYEKANNLNSKVEVELSTKKKRFPKVLLIVLALAFFAVYTFVWIKVFNIELPF